MTAVQQRANPDRPVTFADRWRLPDAPRDLLGCDTTITPTYRIDGRRVRRYPVD